MRIEGTFPVSAGRERVWSMIHDCAVMAACLPGCDSAEQLGPSSYRVVVSVKVGPIKARFTLLVEITASERPAQLQCRTRGEEGSRASQVSADSTLRLEEISADETELTYSSEVSVTGRLGKFGLGVMRKKADQIAADFAKALQARVLAEPVE
ncbi:MAG: SRPBCC domain-containing protein [Kiloniellales bacterium]